MTLTEFLLARITEDEAATPSGDCQCGDGEPQRPDCAARVLAECKAKWLMVEECMEQEGRGPGVDYLRLRVLDLIALPYADHPDYREEWRP